MVRPITMSQHAASRSDIGGAVTARTWVPATATGASEVSRSVVQMT